MNSGGFRDYKPSQTKPKKRFRIAWLGDSFTEAIYAKLEDTHGAIIEQNLQQCPVLKVLIMQFCVKVIRM